MKKGVTLVTRKVYLIAQLLRIADYDRAEHTVLSEVTEGLDDEKTWKEWDEDYGV